MWRAKLLINENFRNDFLKNAHTGFMRKTVKYFFAFALAFIALTTVFFAVSPLKNKAAATDRPKKERRLDDTKDFKLNDKIQNVIMVKPFMLNSKGALAVLSGTGDDYKENVVIYVCRGNDILYEINVADGYSPDIKFFLFQQPQNEKPADKFLFYSSQTGGSGGYGNYVIYKLEDDGYKCLYDVATDTESFSGEFIFGGKMLIKHGEVFLSIDVSYMDKTYYDKIFDEKGNPRGESININAVSSVFPYYNGATKTFGLITYRTVTAVAEVNRLGFISQILNFDGEKFVAEFTNFDIAL